MSYKYLIEQAKEAEKKEELEQAANFYEKARQTEPAEEYPYDRLMIIYRKQKKYKEELKIINQGIIFFREQYENKQKLSGSNKKIVQLSNAFMKSAGLKDKKGKNTYFPEPIPTWQKRKLTIEKKLKKMME